MAKPDPPKTYQEFIRKYPKLGQAWELVGEQGETGPLDGRTVRLVKLGIAMGALRQGAVHSGVRKALAEGIPAGCIDQVVSLAASTLGFPATVALYSWVRDLVKPDGE